MEHRSITLRLTRETWLALLGLGLALFAIIALLPLIINVGLLLFLAVLLALLIYPLANWFEARNIPRGWTVTVVLVIIVGVLLFLIFQLLPLVVNTLSALSRLVADLSEQVDAPLTDFLGVEVGQEGSAALNIMSSVFAQSAGIVGSFAGQFGAIFFAIFVLVVLVSALVNDAQMRQTLLHSLVPQRHHARVISLTHRLSDGLSRWFLAQLAISFYYIVCYSIVNTLIGVPFALPISVIAGLLEFIPYLGGIVGLGLSVLAAATVSVEAVVLVVITNTIIGSVCIYFVSPYFYSRAINIPVAAVLLGLYIGGQVGGFFSALITIPVVTILIILLRELRPATPAEIAAAAAPTEAAPPDTTSG